MHINPCRPQLFQILQIAISMITDLHLDEPWDEAVPRLEPSSNIQSISGGLHLAAQRAYLGCYFISSV